MTSRLQQLTDQGVAVWVDSIARDWIQKGELRRLRDQFQVAGVTSNPTIFQKAMGEGSFYDDDIRRLAAQGLDARRIFESLALDDIRAAAADMEPVYERTGGVDGRISFEVPPDIADDTEATIRDTRRLFDELARPNVFIKIPATAAGVPAIGASIAAGINVNVTLIFSIRRYREVLEAYLSGLEELAASGGDLSEVASVASFFVSRVDTMVDPELQAIADKGGPQAETARARLGTAAIDNAKLAYEIFQQTFQGPRWEALASAGAKVQRPLWASTSTKNPSYRDVLYVEELIARDTVNTMPLETIEAFEDHGEVRGQTA
ncbi:MAG TPA: transaldolase, partial [Actinomycetota bacterium]|nr:transaldolase [Actinomycetota bacterium]